MGEVRHHRRDEGRIESVEEWPHQLLGFGIVDRGGTAHRVVQHPSGGDGNDRVDLDVEACRLCRKHARQPDDRRLGGAIVGHPWRPEDACRRGGVDDAAEVPLPHGLPRGPGDEERTLEVNVHQWAQPFLGHIVEVRVADGACVVDENVDAAPGVECGVDDRLAAVGRCDAVRVGDGVAALVPDLLRRVVGRITAGAVPGHRAAEIVDDDARATFGEKERVLPAEAPARTGDDRDPVVEPQFAHQIGHSSARCVNWIGTARGSRVGFEVDIASIISAT